MGSPPRFLLPLFSTLFFLPFCTPFSGDGAIISPSDFESLLAFKREADPTGVLRRWNGSRTGACAWTGVKCINGRVIALQLPFKGLAGQIPTQIALLRDLRKLSLHDNFIGGAIPSSIGFLPNLRGLHLFNNRLSGSIPPSIGRNPSLQNLDLSNNMLNGSIPPTLGISGRIHRLNLSHNQLSGEVPSSLSKKFNSSSFVGNLKLCGYSRSTQCPSSSSSSPPPLESNHRPKKKQSIKDIILILVGSIIAFLFLLCCAFLCILIRTRNSPTTGTAQKEIEAAESGDNGRGGGKLVLFDGPFVFTANDLLCATAEVMGKNAYGTVYKATIEDGNRVAVKRLREKLAKSPKEFEIEAATLGRIRHPNLLPLRAYYLGPKGEKLLVSDCLSNGTLSPFLHGRGPETSIGWPTRMKIAMGVANGLRHLHVVENFVHGNLTAAEVYLDEGNEPKISDYGVSRLMTDSANTSAIGNGGGGGLAGYRAPELQRSKRATEKSDLYSLGVILLELLTGKSPGELIDGVDLPHWVASTVKEEWTNEVFDVELAGDVGDEMLNALKLALHLVDPTPEVRPEVEMVVQQLQEIYPKQGKMKG